MKKEEIEEIAYTTTDIAFDESDINKFEKSQKKFDKYFEFHYTNPPGNNKSRYFRLPNPLGFYNREKIENIALILKDLVMKIAKAYDAPFARTIKNPENRIFSVQVDGETEKMIGLYLFIFDKSRNDIINYKNYINLNISGCRVFTSNNLLMLEWERGTNSKTTMIELAEMIVMMGELKEN